MIRTPRVCKITLILLRWSVVIAIVCIRNSRRQLTWWDVSYAGFALPVGGLVGISIHMGDDRSCSAGIGRIGVIGNGCGRWVLGRRVRALGGGADMDGGCAANVPVAFENFLGRDIRRIGE